MLRVEYTLETHPSEQTHQQVAELVAKRRKPNHQLIGPPAEQLHFQFVGVGIVAEKDHTAVIITTPAAAAAAASTTITHTWRLTECYK